MSVRWSRRIILWRLKQRGSCGIRSDLRDRIPRCNPSRRPFRLGPSVTVAISPSYNVNSNTDCDVSSRWPRRVVYKPWLITSGVGWCWSQNCRRVLATTIPLLPVAAWNCFSCEATIYPKQVPTHLQFFHTLHLSFRTF